MCEGRGASAGVPGHRGASFGAGTGPSKTVWEQQLLISQVEKLRRGSLFLTTQLMVSLGAWQEAGAFICSSCCLSPTCSDFLSTPAPQIVVPRALEPGCLDSNPASATCCETLEESLDLSGLSFLYLHQDMAKDERSLL